MNNYYVFEVENGKLKYLYWDSFDFLAYVVIMQDIVAVKMDDNNLKEAKIIAMEAMGL